MIPIFETSRDNLTISTDTSRLDIASIEEMLKRAYWAEGRTREAISRSILNSLVFGVYDHTRQIGLARIVSDFTTFAWLCDVFILEEYRGQGVGKWLLETILAYPDIQTLKRFLLATKDAHGLYSQCGFQILEFPEYWMEKRNG